MNIAALTYTVSCLEHVINLGTQKYLSTYSQSDYFDPEHPSVEIHVETSVSRLRDVIGLIRATAVKVSSFLLRSSSMLA